MNLSESIQVAAMAALLFFAAPGMQAQAASKTASAKAAPAASAPAAAPAAAGQPAKGEPAKEEPDTLILSDTLNYDDVAKVSVFTGNVVMTRGLMTLRSDQLSMREDAQGFQFGTATVESGKLVYVRQENPEKFEVVEAKGLRAEYDGKTDVLEMIGQAVVTRFICGKPFDTIRGERVKYHQTTKVYEAFGGPGSAAPGGRVRSLTQPRAKADKAAAECSKKQS